MKKIVFLFFILSSTCFAQKNYQVMSAEEHLLYYYKTGGENVSVGEYLSEFDENFADYSGNEIKFKRKIEETEKILEVKKAALSFNNIYTENLFVDILKGYDLNDEKFNFEPARSANSLVPKGYSYFPSFVEIVNYQDFNGIPFKLSEAEKLIDRIGSSSRKKVYCRRFYSLLNESIKSGHMKAYVYKMEIYLSNCYDDFLFELKAKTPPPAQLIETKKNFDNTITLNPKNYVPDLPVENGWVSIYKKNESSVNYKGVCNYSKNQVQVSVEKKNNELFSMKFKILSNLCYFYSPGFQIKIVTNDGKEFPFKVNQVVNNFDSNTSKILSITINQYTLNLINKNLIKAIDFQFTNSDYSGQEPYISKVQRGCDESLQLNPTFEINNENSLKLKNLIHQSITKF